MHHVLLVPELQQLIFESLLPDINIETIVFERMDSVRRFFPAKQVRSALLNGALTCRAFREAALNALWWAMEDLTPLFKLLSGYRLENVVRGPISNHECKIFFSYAARIKLLYFDGREQPLVPSYMRILAASGRPSLLPSLKYLFCRANAPEIHFFPSTSLRALNISVLEHVCLEAEKEIHALVDNLPNLCTRLIGLRLAHEMTEDCLRNLHGLQNLRYLEVENTMCEDRNEGDVKVIDNKIMNEITSLSQLSRLEIAGDLEYQIRPPKGRPLHSLAMLRSLTFRADYNAKIQDFTGILCLAQFPMLESLDLSYFVIEEAQDIYAFLQALTKATDRGSFHSLTMNSWRLAGMGNVSLAGCSDLLCLQLSSLDTNVFASLTTEDVAAMAIAWPNLKKLRIAPSINFAVLAEIAKQLPELRDLDVAMDKTTPDLTNTPVLSRPLQKLTLSKVTVAPAPNAIALAQCIDMLFPDLQDLVVKGYTPTKSEKDCIAIVKALQKSRKDQQMRDAANGEQGKHSLAGRSTLS